MKISLIKFKRISWKLTASYSLAFSLVLILLSASILYGVRFFLVHQSMNEVNDSSMAISNIITGTKYEQSELSDPGFLSDLKIEAEIKIRISNAGHKIINSSDNFRPIADMYTKFGKTRVVEINNTHYVIRNIKVMSNSKIEAYLQVAKSMEKEYVFMELLLVLLTIADIIGIIISVLVGFLVSRRILKPIDKISRAAKKISASDLKSRIDVGEADDELARLAKTFNEMIERLRLSFEKQKQFVSDASHELRTPIAVVQGYIDLIDRWGKDDKIVLLESIQAIKSETASMTDLIEKLLFLAREDKSTIILKKEKLKLNDLIEEVVKESRLIAPEYNLNYNIDGTIEINVDRKMIKQLLRALVENSLKFTPISSEIEIQASSKSGFIRIMVRDTGIGIPKNELKKIFNRFYRIDKVRAKETGGSGLGLAIAKLIVDAHKGKIYAESTPGVGTSMIIELPEN